MNFNKNTKWLCFSLSSIKTSAMVQLVQLHKMHKCPNLRRVSLVQLVQQPYRVALCTNFVGAEVSL